MLPCDPTCPAHTTHQAPTAELLADLWPDLDAASRPACFMRQRQHLAFELARLQRLHRAAHTRPLLWRHAIAGRQTALSLWLYAIAVAVLAQGLPEAALALIDVLPGIDGGSGGKRALLRELATASVGAGELDLAA